MPRAFSEQDREAIQTRLLEVARGHFTRFGYRKATVGGISRDTGISKGTFYHFFESKAAAFIAVAETVEDELRLRLTDADRRLEPSDGRTRLRELLHFHFDTFSEEPLLGVVLDPLEASVLFREVEPAVAAAHQIRDVMFFDGLLETWRRDGAHVRVESPLLLAVLRAFYVVTLHADVVGRDQLSQVLELLADGVATRLTDP